MNAKPIPSKPRPFTVITDMTVKGVCFPAGSIIGLDERGALWRCHLSGETIINGAPCMADTEVEFHQDGAMAAYYPARDIIIEGIIVSGGALTLFHENGTLFRCVLAGDAIIHGINARAGTELCLFDDGRVSSFETDGSFQAEFPVMPNSRVWLHRDGSLKAATQRESGKIVWFNDGNHD
ncbi:MAG: hypothetical protein HZA20_06185 [Nitrospirae bacterium]|nr:hypothetical protein [Nitrospirota bacterium]